MSQGVFMQNFIFTNICNYTVTQNKNSEIPQQGVEGEWSEGDLCVCA